MGIWAEFALSLRPHVPFTRNVLLEGVSRMMAVGPVAEFDPVGASWSGLCRLTSLSPSMNLSPPPGNLCESGCHVSGRFFCTRTWWRLS